MTNFTNASNIQLTFNSLINLSKTELKRCATFATLTVAVFCSALFLLILAVITESSMTQYADFTIKFLIAAAGLLASTLIFFRMTRICILRLQTVVEPPANTFSFNSYSPLNSNDSRSNMEKQTNNIESNLAANPQIAEDSLPQAASRFYAMLENAKESALELFNNTLSPVFKVKSLIEQKPLTAIGIAAVVGNFMSVLLVSKKQPVKNRDLESKIQAEHYQPQAAPIKKSSLFYSALTDLTVMALTYGAQTLIREMFSSQTTTRKVYDNNKAQSSSATYAGQIIPFNNRQQSKKTSLL